ncbi:putative ribonuclease H-like domain-containing protein [Tanacetum coccineum]
MAWNMFILQTIKRLRRYVPLEGTPKEGKSQEKFKSYPDARFKPLGDDEKKVTKEPGKESGDPSKVDERYDQEKDASVNSTNNVNAGSTNEVNAICRKASIELLDDPNMPALEDIVYSDDDEDVGAEADMNNLDAFMSVSPISTTRVHKDNPVEEIIRDLNSVPQTRRMTKNLEEHVYVDDIIFGSTKKKLCNAFEKLMHEKFQMSSMGELTFFLGLQVQQKKDGIFISQDKYVGEILKKFRFIEVKTASTPIETQKPLLKDEDVCACVRHQVNPKVSHLYDMKRVFRYLKGQPKLGLWYLKDSPFDLIAYTDSDYAGASLDRKSTTGGCQFLRCRLISWQCKKQTVVENSTTEAEYVAASSCYGQVLWIQNQLLDYGYNFMQTKIFIDNESTICIVKNPVFHSKTKHIEIKHHFIRDLNEKKLIQMIKIHTDKNVADLLTKAFDVSRFQYLIASIGMLNL